MLREARSVAAFSHPNVVSHHMPCPLFHMPCGRFTCHVERPDVPRGRDTDRPVRARRAMWTRHWPSSSRSTCHVDATLAVQPSLHVPRERETGGPARASCATSASH
jgi:hypothetical protein